MVDSYRPMRRDRDPPPPKPLAERMTFGNGDTYRPGQSDFTFESNHPAPRFPPSGPANGRGGRRGPRGGRRDQQGGSSHHGRNNASGRRGGFRKAMAHERALLQHRDDGNTEHTYGVSDGPSRFMNIDDMSDDEEAEMDESDASGDDSATTDQKDTHKVARTRAPQPDGNAVPKWSNPDPYTSLPPPSETTGVKRDVVQLIRKAKNQIAEKAVNDNPVAANDDFISFGNDLNDDDDDDSNSLHIYEDDEPIRGRANGRASPHPMQGSMNDVVANRRGTYDSYEPPRNTYDSYAPPAPSRSKKRGKPDGGVAGIVQDWQPTSRNPSTPWAVRHQYEHLVKIPERW